MPCGDLINVVTQINGFPEVLISFLLKVKFIETSITTLLFALCTTIMYNFTMGRISSLAHHIYHMGVVDSNN
jgi:hypothetical protein